MPEQIDLGIAVCQTSNMQLCYFFSKTLHDCGKEMLLPSILKKTPNKTIEIHVVDERDLKYILTPMACFVTNYNNSCMFNLYSLSAIKNHDTPLMKQ